MSLSAVREKEEFIGKGGGDWNEWEIGMRGIKVGLEQGLIGNIVLAFLLY